jgi:methionine salvage enolase-phosphatase E1
MNNAQKYFAKQMKNKEFKESFNAISEQIHIERELERMKTQIKNNTDKNIILTELEKLQTFVHNTMFVSNQNRVVQH